jgi:hypothetical protein
VLEGVTALQIFDATLLRLRGVTGGAHHEDLAVLPRAVAEWRAARGDSRLLEAIRKRLAIGVERRPRQRCRRKDIETSPP